MGMQLLNLLMSRLIFKIVKIQQILSFFMQPMQYKNAKFHNYANYQLYFIPRYLYRIIKSITELARNGRL